MSILAEDKIYMNGRVYRLSLEADVTADKFLDDRVHEITDPLVMSYIAEANNLSFAEHQRILNEVRATQITIAPEHYLLPVVGIGNKSCLLRSIVYAPNRIIGMKSYWKDMMRPDWDGFKSIEDWEALRDDAYFECVGRPKHFMSMMCARYETYIITSRQNYHSMSVAYYNNSIKWHEMCIGNATPDQYWNVPFEDFCMNVNTINLESIGKHEILFGSNPISVRTYIADLPYKVFTQKTRGATWTA
jgi:hypothetical protein